MIVTYKPVKTLGVRFPAVLTRSEPQTLCACAFDKSKLSHQRDATAGEARLKREAELVVRRGADEGLIDEAGGEIPSAAPTSTSVGK